MKWVVLVFVALGALVLIVWLYLRSLKREVEAIRELMSDGQWHRGIDLVKASNGRLRRGTIYAILNRLENGGVIESRAEAYTQTLELRRYRIKPEPTPTAAKDLQ